MAVWLRNGHSHAFLRVSSRNRAHRHFVATISGRAIVLPDGSHVHLIRSLTTFNRVHLHLTKHLTGRGMPSGRAGMHVHRYRDVTTRDVQHRHLVSGTTVAAPNIPQRLVRRALRAGRRGRYAY